MKKSFIILSLLFLSLSNSASAQETEKTTTTTTTEVAPLHRVEFGFRFMPTISAFTMQTSSGGTVKGEATLGYGIGGMLAFNVSNHVGIQAEVIYNSLSQKFKDQNLDREIKVRYINIPLLFTLNTGKSNPVNLNVVFGPQLGLNLGSSVSTSGSGSNDTLTTVIALKKSDFGIAYGAGLDFALNSTRTIRLDVGFRGVYGLANISNSNTNPETGTYYVVDRAKVRTKSAYIGITFLF